MALLPGFLSGLSLKAAAGLALAAAAVGGGAAASVATHSVDPVNWGQAVVQAVQGCKAQYLPSPGATPSPGQENVGACVSAIARQHGVRQRQLHSKGRGSGMPSGLPSAASSRGHRPTTPGEGRPSSLPTKPGRGRPSSLPTPG